MDVTERSQRWNLRSRLILGTFCNISAIVIHISKSSIDCASYHTSLTSLCRPHRGIALAIFSISWQKNLHGPSGNIIDPTAELLAGERRSNSFAFFCNLWKKSVYFTFYVFCSDRNALITLHPKSRIKMV